MALPSLGSGQDVGRNCMHKQLLETLNPQLLAATVNGFKAPEEADELVHRNQSSGD